MNVHVSSRFSRLPFAAAIAFLTTSFLFLMMTKLIAEEAGILTVEAPLRLAFLPTVVDEPPVVRPPRAQPPPDVVPPPPVPRVEDGVTVEPLPLTPTVAPRREGPKIGPASIVDGQALPIFKVTPQYPQRAQSRGVTGHVLLSLTIGPTGAVTEVAVVEAVPEGYFESAAIAAAKRFKYRPKVVDGHAVEQTGILNLITFDLPEQS